MLTSLFWMFVVCEMDLVARTVIVFPTRVVAMDAVHVSFADIQWLGHLCTSQDVEIGIKFM